MMPTNDKGLLDNFMREIMQLHDQGVALVLDLGPNAAIALIGAIQLACRHPAYTGPSRLVVEDIVHDLERGFAVHNVPNVLEVIRRGWDQQYDEKGDRP
jgi:hypothetical protein